MKRWMKRIGVAVAIIGGLVGAFVGTIFFFSSDEREIAREFLFNLSSADYEDLSKNWRKDLKEDFSAEQFQQQFGGSQNYTSVSFTNVSVEANGPTRLAGVATTDLGCKSNVKFSMEKGEIYFINISPACRIFVDGERSVQREIQVAQDFLKSLEGGSYEEASVDWTPQMKASVSKGDFEQTFIGTEATEEVNFQLVETFQGGTAKLSGVAKTERKCESEFAISFEDGKIIGYSIKPICTKQNTLSNEELQRTVQRFVANLSTGSYELASADWHPTLKAKFGPNGFLRSFSGMDRYVGDIVGDIEVLDGGMARFVGHANAISGCRSELSISFIQDAMTEVSVNPTCVVENKLSLQQRTAVVNEFLRNVSAGNFADSMKDWHPGLRAQATAEDLKRSFGGIDVIERIEIVSQTDDPGRGNTLNALATTEDGCDSNVRVWFLQDRIRSFNIDPLCPEK